MNGREGLLSPRVLLFCLLGILVGCSEGTEERKQYLPEISLIGVKDGELQLSALAGKVLVLNAWAPWCPPCLEEMPSLERLSRQLDPSRYQVIGLTTGDRFLALEFLESNEITFGNYFIDQSALEAELGVQAFPETLIIAADGRVVERYLGARDWASAQVLAELESLWQASLSP